MNTKVSQGLSGPALLDSVVSVSRLALASQGLRAGRSIGGGDV